MARRSGEVLRLRKLQTRSVFVRQQRHVKPMLLKRPLNADVGVVPDDAALVLWCVVIGCFLYKIGLVTEHPTTMRQPGRHPELPVILL